MPEHTPWLEALGTLRPLLAGRREGGTQVGSLRWLEAQMRDAGASSGAVRNIVYRDIGTPEDKVRLRNALERLASGLAVALPERLRSGQNALELGGQARQLLGRDKRMVYRQFLGGVQAGRAPKLIVYGRHGSGKTLLMDHLSQGLGEVHRLHLGGELSGDLERLFRASGQIASSLHRPLAKLSGRLPYALQGELQAELARALLELLRSRPLPLLVRAGNRGELAGLPLRLRDGATVGPDGWVWHHLLEPLSDLEIPVLGLLSGVSELPESLGPYREAVPLNPPSLEEARRFVRLKLPEAPPARVERLVAQAGRDFEALSLMVLLEGLEAGGDSRLPALRDTAFRDFLEALSVLFPQGRGELGTGVLAEVLGLGDLSTLPDLERAFLEAGPGGQVRPISRALVEKLLERYPHDRPLRRTALHRRALGALERAGQHEAALHHALNASDPQAVLRLCLNAVPPPSFSALEAAWLHLLERDPPPEEPETELDALTLLVVEHYTTLGRFEHPSVQRGLDHLERSENPDVRALAGVRRIEALVDALRFEEARALLAALPEALEVKVSPRTRTELALVRVALLRWEGQAAEALSVLERAAQHALEAALEPLTLRVQFWQGLLAKDLGRWEQAIADLERSAGSEGGLLAARARYQLGDLLMRLGQQGRAQSAFERALGDLLGSEAPAEEQSRARTGLGTALRRLGQLEAASAHFAAAMQLAPDPYTRARAQSEATLAQAALGHFGAALELGCAAHASFQATETIRPQEGAYRRGRAAYRLAMVYLARGLGQSYLPPLLGASADHPDLHHARALLEGGLRELEQAELTQPAPNLPRIEHAEAERTAALRMDLHMGLTLATPDPLESVGHARAALGGAAHPYAQFQAHTYLAEALLRAGQSGAALHEVNRAHTAARRAARLSGSPSLDEPGFLAWLALLEAGVLRLQGEAPAAREVLETALADPVLRPFRAHLGVQALALGFAVEDLGLESHPLLRAQDVVRASLLRP